MTGDPRRTPPGGDGDSWETLAQDLFGIEFSSDPAGDDLPLLDETPTSPSHAQDAEQDRHESESPSIDDDGDSEQGDDLVELTEDDIVDDDEFEDEPEEVAAEADEARPDDSYWDALNDWQWDESPRERSGERSKGHDSKRPGRGRREGREERRPPREPAPPATPAPAAFRANDDFPSTSDFREEYVDDDAFGAGLLGDVSASSSEAAEQTESGADRQEGETGPERDGRRRRRRRRRGRRSRPEETQNTETSESQDDVAEDDVAEDDVAEDEVTETSSADESESSEEEVRDRGERRPRRRRRRRRREGSRSDESTSPAEATRPSVDASTDDDVDDDDDDDEIVPVAVEGEDDDSDEDSDSQWDPTGEATYRNIPTWEEAISYLLNPSRVDATPREGSQRPAEKGPGDRPAEGRGSRHKSGSRPSGRRRRRR